MKVVVMCLLNTVTVIPLILLTAVSSAVSAQQPTPPPGFDGSLEYRIEIGQHENFVRLRRSTGAGLVPFVSDGCSGGLSTGWSFVSKEIPVVARYHGDKPPWESCCTAHDRLYHEGGPAGSDAKTSFKERREADEQLRRCVIETGEARKEELAVAYGFTGGQVTLIYRIIAGIMYRAVRLGGAPCSRLPWRWGFGWPNCE